MSAIAGRECTFPDRVAAVAAVEAAFATLFAPLRCGVSAGWGRPDQLPVRREELESAGRMSIVRARQFYAGRQQARKALGLLGLRESPVLREADGAPKWPDGVSGSLAHAGALSAAVVCDDPRVLGIGIDAEALRREFPEGVGELVFTREEQRRLARLEAEQHFLLFSVKEAVMKAVRHATGVRPDWHDIVIINEFGQGGFMPVVRNNRSARRMNVVCKAAFAAGHAIAACVVYAAQKQGVVESSTDES